jgi:hypothetical protein
MLTASPTDFASTSSKLRLDKSLHLSIDRKQQDGNPRSEAITDSRLTIPSVRPYGSRLPIIASHLQSIADIGELKRVINEEPVVSFS